jgi:mRNA interferase MazF
MTRGEVFRIRSPRGARGRDQRGSCYGVVIQADELFGLSTVLLVPTSTTATATTFRPAIEIDGTRTRLLPEQAYTVDLNRLGSSAGRLDAQELSALDEALTLVLGL